MVLREFPAGKKLVRIGANAFYDCTNLDFSIPDGVKKIEKEAFSMVRAMKKVVLPAGLDFLGKAA